MHEQVNRKRESDKIVVFMDQRIEDRADFLLINPKTLIHVVLKRVHKKEFSEILNFDFVLHCMREGVFFGDIALFALQKPPKI
jgi:hypothetical protein